MKGVDIYFSVCKWQVALVKEGMERRLVWRAKSDSRIFGRLNLDVVLEQSRSASHNDKPGNDVSCEAADHHIKPGIFVVFNRKAFLHD